MKVISGPEKWTVRKKCNSCTAELEIDTTDVFIGLRGGDYTEAGTDHVCASCCICGTDIVIGSIYRVTPVAVHAAKARSKK